MSEEQFQKRIDLLFEFMEANQGDDPNILSWGHPLSAVYHYVLSASGTQKAKDKKLHQILFRELIAREIEMLRTTLSEAEKNWEEEDERD